MKKYNESELIALRDQNEQWLMAQPGVTGTGIGLSTGARVVLRIYTSGISPPARVAIATRLGDIPVEWEEGDIVPQ